MRFFRQLAVARSLQRLRAGRLDEIEHGLVMILRLGQRPARDDNAGAGMAFALVIERELNFRANGEGPLGQQAHAFGRPLNMLPTEIDRVGETHRDLRILAWLYFSRGSHTTFIDSG